MDISEFYDTFFEEAQELLAEMERLLLALDVEAPDAEQLNAIFRAAHSIKGGAATFGFTVLQDTTHHLENLLDRARRGELRLSIQHIDRFLETKDMLDDQLAAYRNAQSPDPEAYAHIVAVLKQLGEESSMMDALSAPVPPGEASGPVVDVEMPPTVESQAGVEASVPLLSVTLMFVADRERELLIEELANLGEIISSSGDEQVCRVIVSTTVSAEDIEAVLCFVIEPEQILIGPATPASPAGGDGVVGDTVGGVADGQAEALSEALVTEQAEGVADDMSADAASDLADQTAPAEATVDAGSSADVSSAGMEESSPAGAEGPSAAAQASGERRSQSGRRATGAPTEQGSIRVGVDKVDTIINLVGELIITQSMLEQTASATTPPDQAALVSGISQLQRNARDLQEAVMSVRMMPMDYVFSRFPRLIRDLASRLGKQVELVSQGHDTELDKSLIERIIDPLTHLVRNSLDHGIESPSEREASGKSAHGTLTLSARHQGGNIVIEVMDDGAGLDRVRILAKARSNGLAVSDGMSDDEVWQLIFAPGFSTAEQVSDVSGRGVGMDVVKRNIQALGGQVELASVTGQGTTTRIVLPLTLAILEGMAIRVGEEIYILPLSVVVESLQPQADMLFSMVGNDRLLKVRDEYLSLVALHEVFAVPGAQTQPEQGIVVVVQGKGRHYALLVDELIGQQQVVVKNLERNYRKVPGVSSATILGDGRVSLILDVSDLHRLANQMPAVQRQAEGVTESAMPQDAIVS
ncbi:chemotaxis protein CheA [Cobetia amphilecti]|jgi:two-component system chemotaxis sensor kinase CheA|uniref:Chemotaxis protein CheA n=2 Tax=Cobetia TaxID=204286 RepID=A0ABT6ULJ2_9GAMM|nr:chemotaxis protein CheA [Cobetia amphilecti]MDI5882734.1 chemotaxis protein CheA [Cobetia amphilecti]